MSHTVGVQSQKASGSLHDHEQNMQNNNKMGGAHDQIRKPIRSENCSSDQHQRRGEPPLRADPRPPYQRQQLPLRAGQQSDHQHQHQGQAVCPSDQRTASDQHQLRSGHNKHPLSAPHIPVQGISEAQLRQTQERSGSQYHQSSTGSENIVTPPIIQPRQHSKQCNDNQHTDQLERHSDQHTDQRDQHTEQRTGQRDRYTDQHYQHTDQRTSEAQLRQTQGRGPQYYQSSTCRENIVTPPIIQPRQHSEQRNDNQHTDQHDQHTEGHTGQHDQHTDKHDQHTNQCLDQHTNQSRSFSWAERILNLKAISPVQSLPSKSVGNPLGDNPEKKELSDTGPRSVDVETSIAGLKDLKNSPTSSSPELYTKNPLVTDVDKEMAEEAREEVESLDLATSLDDDSNNLVCPNCGKKHYIGGPRKFRDIQKFHLHVNQCDVKKKIT